MFQRKDVYALWGVLSAVFFFMAGILFAIGHHLFYKSLVGQPTSGDYTIVGSQFSGQQLNIAVGTAFAFLVKASFALAASVAYFQLFWRMAKRKSKMEERPTLARLDAAYSGSTNLISFLRAPMWFGYPLMFAIAATIWLVPIASIITPATLSVTLLQNIPHIIRHNIPQIDFYNLNFAAPMAGIDGASGISLYYTYDGPSQITKQIAMGVASQNSILPVAAPFPNASWALQFNGPSLRCASLPTAQSLAFQKNIARYLKQGYAPHIPVLTNSYCGFPPTYLAWYPRVISGMTVHEPYPIVAQNSSNTSSLTFPDPASIFENASENFTIQETETVQEAVLYVAVMPNMLGLTQFTLSTTPNACYLTQKGDLSHVTSENPLGLVGGDITMMKCQLYNTTYHTRFDFKNGVQNVTSHLVQNSEQNTVPIINLVRGPGANGIGAGKCATLNENNGTYGDECHFDSSLLSQIAYQSILQAFTDLITGNITLDYITLGLTDSADIRSTGLVNTKELFYLTDYAVAANSSIARPALQQAIYNSSESEVSGMAKLHQNRHNISLQHALETMFQNFTISLMTSSALQPNYSSASAPAKATVTHFTAATVYTYSAMKLWLAYGIAALFTLASVITGMVVILSSGVSYENVFSTVLRTARATELSVEIKSEDLNGASPLPGYLKKATVGVVGMDGEGLGSRKRKEGGSGDIRTDPSSKTGLLNGVQSLS